VGFEWVIMQASAECSYDAGFCVDDMTYPTLAPCHAFSRDHVVGSSTACATAITSSLQHTAEFCPSPGIVAAGRACRQPRPQVVQLCCHKGSD
jgi:hypothetical protein